MSNKLKELKLTFKAEIESKTRSIYKNIEQINIETKEIRENLGRKYSEELVAKEQLRIQQENERALYSLIDAIQAAEDALKLETDGIKAAIVALEHYSNYLDNPTQNNITPVVEHCRKSLELLTSDIKNKRFGDRVLSSLQGLLLAIAGFVATILVGIPCVILLSKTAGPKDDTFFGKGIGSVVKLCAIAFDCLDEAWTGKIKPRELKTLQRNLKELIQNLDKVPKLARNSIFISSENTAFEDKESSDPTYGSGQHHLNKN